MDLYSSDFAGIQEGNMRTKSILDANRAVQEHNKSLGEQMTSLKSQQKTADVLEQTKDATQGFWAMGKLPDATKAWKSWSSGETNFRGNPTTTAQKSFSDTADAVQAADKSDDIKMKSLGDGIFESAESDAQTALSEGGSGGLKGLGEFADIASKGVGALAAGAVGGYDIYEDFAGGKGFHIAGDNWASKASNLLQIGGAIADIGGTVFPPLALIGGVADIAGGIAGEIGEKIDEGKEKSEDDKVQQENTEQQQAVGVQAPQVTGRVS
jgi:hypothetical protein